jgi:hypothetical protein
VSIGVDRGTPIGAKAGSSEGAPDASVGEGTMIGARCGRSPRRSGAPVGTMMGILKGTPMAPRGAGKTDGRGKDASIYTLGSMVADGTTTGGDEGAMATSKTGKLCDVL